MDFRPASPQRGIFGRAPLLAPEPRNTMKADNKNETKASEGKVAYESPRVEAVQLSQEAAEALTCNLVSTS